MSLLVHRSVRPAPVRRAWLVAICAALVLLVTLASTPVAGADAGARVVFEVHRLRSDRGVVRGALFASSDGWTERGREIATCEGEIHGGVASCDLGALPPGRYAFAFLHDEDDDGELDRDRIGIPSEGFGFSNDASPQLGPPSFQTASFEHERASTRVVHARYGL